MTIGGDIDDTTWFTFLDDREELCREVEVAKL